ncbi:MAG: type II toxin-antitoxin system HicA family toxin [Candidatus Vogelbacteria bacterium]|nr:type II toxin-antitoxin system HicA family toxin [Candidatus Vogelbacteria bacterium]
MPHLPKAGEAIRVIEKLGFIFKRQKVSHAIYRHSDGRRITIPNYLFFFFGCGIDGST